MEQSKEIIAKLAHLGISDPDLIDSLPLLFSELLTPPTYRVVVTHRLRHRISDNPLVLSS